MSEKKQIIDLSDEEHSGNETDDTEEFNDEEEAEILEEQLKPQEIQKSIKNSVVSPLLVTNAPNEFIKNSEIPDSLKNLYSNKKTKKKESKKKEKATNLHLNSSLQSNFNASSNQGDVVITGSLSQNKFVFNDPFNKPRSPYKCYRCGQLKKGHICAKSLANISSLPGLHSNFSNLTTKAQFTFANPIQIMNQSSFVPSSFYGSSPAPSAESSTSTSVPSTNPILQPLTVSTNTSPLSKSPLNISVQQTSSGNNQLSVSVDAKVGGNIIFSLDWFDVAINAVHMLHSHISFQFSVNAHIASLSSIAQLLDHLVEEKNFLQQMREDFEIETSNAPVTLLGKRRNISLIQDIQIAGSEEPVQKHPRFFEDL